MWYSSFWSEGPKNHRNLKILVSKFVPRGFEARRTWGFEAQRHGVSRSLKVPSDYQGPRGTAPNDKSLKSFISGAAPRNPMAPPLETPAPPLETPWRRASKPQVRRASKPLGTKFETKIFKFRWFLGPSDQNELYHTPLLSKI